MDHVSVPYKHQRLKDYLLASLASGSYAEGSLLPSEQSLSRQFGISRNTVRQALKSLEVLGYLYSVRGKGTFVRSCQPHSSRKIALLIHDTAYMTHAVTGEMICGIDSHLQGAGYVLDVLASRRSVGDEQVSQMLESYAGFLIGAYQIDPLILQALAHSGRPFLFVKNYLPGYGSRAVRVDYVRAGFLVAEHLICRGCVDLGLIYAGDAISISADFGCGVRSACLEYGVRLRQKNVVICDYMSAVGGHVVDSFGDSLPDGIICQTDEQAIGLCQALQARGIGVPDCVRVTGCNHWPQVPAGVPSLTTLELSSRGLGVRAAEFLLSLISGDAGVCPAPLEPVLVIGESTGVVTA